KDSAGVDLRVATTTKMSLMFKKHLHASLLLGFLLVLAPRVGQAWNSTGHRVIASIAYRQLDEPTRAKVGAILRKHPAYVELWAKRDANGPIEVENLFWNASIFPDEARRPPWDRYNRPTEHYVNFRIFAEQGNRVQPPVSGENVLNSYVAHVNKAGDPATSDEDR